MYYVIYKTTNTINGKYYIGKHKTNNLDDGYIGSGRLLLRAVKKYGKENFKTEILETHNNEQDLNEAEKRLVTPNIETNYNLCPGGQGGFGYINATMTPEQRIEISRKGGLTPSTFNEKSRQRLQEGGRIAAKILNEKIKLGFIPPPTLGKKRSLETRQKISLAMRGRIPWNKKS